MKDFKKNLKALALLLGLAVAMPFSAQAQTTKSMYHEGSLMDDPTAKWQSQGLMNDRSIAVTTWAINNNGIGQPEVPLGSGLLILGAAGAGYFIAKRRKNNKKNVALILAALMLLGFTQCKKEEPVTQDEPKGIYITLTTNGSNNGSRVDVDPTGHTSPDYATVTWEDGDVIYVGNNGAYCGYLKYDEGKFGGTITPTSGDDGDYLHFYFMGNMGEESQPTSVSISDQRSSYPVISYGRSTTLFNSGTTEYSATLYNKCAIVKFTTTDIDKDITIKGMYNTVTVDFSKNGKGDPVNPYTYSKTGPGYITLHRESNTERWAILLPQVQVTTAKAYAPGYATASAFTVPAIEANTYHDTPIEVNLAEGDVFSVSNSKAVHFSPGNLQYKVSDGTWRFAEHQWDVPDVQGSGKWNTSEWVSLFGWGTWGEGKSPLNTSTNNSDYLWDTDFHGTLNGHDDWYTLSSDQWIYLIGLVNSGSNEKRDGVRYLNATITVSGNDYYGLIIFPDGYMGYGVIGDYTYNNLARVSVSADDWSAMETAGAVFLPGAGRRSGNTADFVYTEGRYWSNTAKTGTSSYCVNFDPTTPSVAPGGTFAPKTGLSVRLVRN